MQPSSPSYRSTFEEENLTSLLRPFLSYEDLSSKELLFLKSVEKDLDKSLEGKVVDYSVIGKKIIPLDYGEETVLSSNFKDGGKDLDDGIAETKLIRKEFIGELIFCLEGLEKGVVSNEEDEGSKFSKNTRGGDLYLEGLNEGIVVQGKEMDPKVSDLNVSNIDRSEELSIDYDSKELPEDKVFGYPFRFCLQNFKVSF